MVQPAASTSTYACMIDPIVNSAPSQLISGPCSAIGSPASVAPPGVNSIEQGKIFLNRLFNEFAGDFDYEELVALMNNERAGNAFLAHLIVYYLVMDPAKCAYLEIPLMVNQGLGLTPLTFMESVERLRTAFTGLNPVNTTQVSGNHDHANNNFVSEAVCEHFINRHLTTDIPQAVDLNRSSEELVDDDVFDPTLEHRNSSANVFYGQLKALSKGFTTPGANPTFVAAANTMREEQIRIPLPE